MTGGDRRQRAGEAGYAMVAAVVAIAVLALMSLSLIDTSRGITVGVLAEAERARLAAAADAALAVTIRNLAEPDRSQRWSVDGRPHNMRYAGTDLVILVEDERGKIPLNQLAEEQARALFEALGASGENLSVITDSFLDWIDDDDEPRQHGAEIDYYANLGRRPRNGPLHSIDELLGVRGMTPDLVARLRTTATAYRNEREGFDDRFAAPLALAVMGGGGPGSPAVINREHELAGQRPAIELSAQETLVARPLTIRIVARRPGGGRYARSTLVELTGRADQPYVVRGTDIG